MEWVNNQYVKAGNADQITSLAIKQLIKAGRLPENPSKEKIEWARQLTNLYKQQMSYAAEMIDLSSVFFDEPESLSEDALKELSQETAPVVLQEFAAKIKELPVFDAFEIQSVIMQIQKEKGIRGRKLYMPIRIATTHEMHGPDLAPSIELIGREKVLSHLDKTFAELGIKF